MDILKCPVCNTDLKLSLGYTGCDWNCKAGEGSGYGWELHLNCLNNKCARVYTIGHVKEYNDFSEAINKLKRVR